MTTAAAAQAFVAKWDQVTVNEKAAAQSHFNDLCDLLDIPQPLQADPAGTWYRFEKPLKKEGGGAGFADVWRQDTFALEYKTKGKYRNLDEAYKQLLLYNGDLGNPPALIVCDIANYEIHIEITNYKSRVERFTNADLLNAATRDLLRLALTDPQQLRPVEKTFTITEKIAADFARVAQWVEGREDPQRVAHFFMKLLFAMFAEDIGLLPNKLLTESIRAAILNPAEFNDLIRPLFRVMRDGGYFGPGNRIPHFNGGLFDDDDAIPLKVYEIERLSLAAQQDWRDVEPAIFGTLFERSLDPAKRAQLGAHYTSRDDILLLVEPVLMAPLRREWAATMDQIERLRPQFEAATGAAKQRARNAIEGQLFAFAERVSSITVLDAACGSGNFLYVALHALKDLERDVITYATAIGVSAPEQAVGPHQLFGIERNPFAAELAQVVVWIGQLQWNSKHGFPNDQRPVLQKLHNIRCADAILDYDLQTGAPIEPEWPAVNVILGNPPFLGSKNMRGELGDQYVETLRKLYAGRVPGGADLVTYWFEKARAQIGSDQAKRAGLIATNVIRQQNNRFALNRIKQSGDIFLAWSDRPWILDGAAVRIAMIAFDNGSEQERTLDGVVVDVINPDLTGTLDLTNVPKLRENEGLAYMGVIPVGAFDISAQQADAMLKAANSSGRSNRDVIRPWLGGQDITDRPRNNWIIDFGINTSEHEAALYEAPYEYVQTHVKPERQNNNRAMYRRTWWIHGEARPGLRKAVQKLQRYIATVLVAKHRLFVWVDASVLPAARLIAIARDDDYFFGALHSRAHEVWSLRLGGQHGGERPTYNPSTTFETFPFPWPPGAEDHADPRVIAIAEAARELVRRRDEWLNPPELIDGGALKDRTLTNLYNARPDWLTEAHRALDAAVFAAYGWPDQIGDDEILARLLALNAERAGTAKDGSDDA